MPAIVSMYDEEWSGRKMRLISAADGAAGVMEDIVLSAGMLW
jgi:hypothetical protein